jgi:hypothetical protein
MDSGSRELPFNQMDFERVDDWKQIEAGIEMELEKKLRFELEPLPQMDLNLESE